MAERKESLNEKKIEGGQKKRDSKKQIKDFIVKGDDRQEKGLLKWKQLRREKKWNEGEIILGW